MSKLIMLSGLPASGKSTRAAEIVASGNWVRLNRDLLREMLHFDKWSGKNEGITVGVEKLIASYALSVEEMNVIIDDCNLNPKNKEMWHQVAVKCDATFEHEYIDTDWLDCVSRDMNRNKSVGMDVIAQMALLYEKYDKPEKGFVICDLDGTICEISHRLHHVKVPEGTPKNWKGFFEAIPGDKIRPEVVKIVSEYIEKGYRLILVSARPEDYRKETVEWLNEHFVHGYVTLIMRKKGDSRPDTEVKQEIFNSFFKNKYHVEAVIDDRPSVIRMWRENGLNVIDVGAGVEF